MLSEEHFYAQRFVSAATWRSAFRANDVYWCKRPLATERVIIFTAQREKYETWSA